MELITAKGNGWPALRLRTFQRDIGCVAPQPEIMGELHATDPCREGDSSASPRIRWDDLAKMEFDHVREQPGGRRYDDEAHGITVCPWHHRGAGWRSDTTEHRAKERAYLARLYPAVWKA